MVLIFFFNSSRGNQIFLISITIIFFLIRCGPCKRLKPAWLSLTDQFESKALFLTIDVDENEAFASEFHVEKLPHFSVFKKGQLMDSTCGASHVGF